MSSIDVVNIIVSYNEQTDMFNGTPKTNPELGETLMRRYSANIQIKWTRGGLGPVFWFTPLGEVLLQNRFSAISGIYNGLFQTSLDLLHFPDTFAVVNGGGETQCFATPTSISEFSDNVSQYGKSDRITTFEFFSEAEYLTVTQTWTRDEGNYGI